MADKKISGFKKFTDLKTPKELDEAELNAQPETDSDRPANPNLPNKSQKVQRLHSRKGVIPQDQNLDFSQPRSPPHRGRRHSRSDSGDDAQRSPSRPATEVDLDLHPQLSTPQPAHAG